ncbi:F-box protein FBW2-like [Pyrus ussuriensis x Pyrus communis]|uniref:F-box protein FBW2-like n=1 Tax=Pyrus ussuriensis x Pyrus communis TaxID=2448454 RepID=A0A5N5F3W6_9ROSA|nr:F-box protein FBW2-like [Pyrus ussuriensis x Pyrus communis]
MEEDSEFRRWDELIPDALGLIFRNLTLQETLTVIPRVCKSWGRAVSGPYCWQEIDIAEWSKFRPPETVTRMLQMLVIRSSGSLRKLCVAGLPNDQTFSFIADHAKSLRTLQLPRSEISDSIVEQVAARLSSVTFLDVSYCKTIGGPALEAFGKHCRHLRKLQRCMYGWEVLDKVSQDDEALAIAATMPKLKHLEILCLHVSTEAVRQILLNCPELQLLDVRGCYSVKLDEKFVKKFSGLKLVGPGSYNVGWDDCSDYSVSSGYLAWDVMDDDFDEEMLDEAWEDDLSMEDVEMRFYDGFYLDNGGFDWPLSP